MMTRIQRIVLYLEQNCGRKLDIGCVGGDFSKSRARRGVELAISLNSRHNRARRYWSRPTEAGERSPAQLLMLALLSDNREQRGPVDPGPSLQSVSRPARRDK